ncbi:hypothetical protein XM38_040330 [Halomicronema hongdechloris C2206]|uniref:Cell division protein FtsL n=1 Tax=Halomicronema hongdechloris C2206 TaxID=1641165 RepID=A0A1Z3HRY1_9CYAN|nr:hypothetical protein [Halomicronema hongdechloris]ASC73071.1 hypothetical protein XM38_040330 [Halomicronema hongdechloris C2206]
MHAAQSPTATGVVASPISRRRRRSPLPRPRRRLVHTLELTATLAINGLLMTVAVVTLSRLVPHYQAQRQQFQQVNSALRATKADMAALQAEFSRHFDPAQATQIMQEQSGWTTPSERQIVWISPGEAPHPSQGSQ